MFDPARPGHRRVARRVNGGHTDEAWSEPLFLAHVLGGIEYAIDKRAAPLVPKIDSLSAKVHGRRVTVTVRYTGCTDCKGTLRVAAATSALHAAGGVATGTSPRLPRGHTRVYVVLTDGYVRLTASRPLVIR